MDPTGPNYQPPSVNDTEQVPPQAPQTITLQFKDQHENALTFKVKPTTKLGKAMDAYSAHTERPRTSLRFLFEGTRIIDKHTPDELEMEDDCVVEVHEEQIGGSRADHGSV